MRFYCLLSLLAVASAFTTRSPAVGGFTKNVVADSTAHRNRQATIVMSGKANGEWFLVPQLAIRGFLKLVQTTMGQNICPPPPLAAPKAA